MPSQAIDWPPLLTAIFAGLLVAFTGLAFQQGLIGGGRLRPIRIRKPMDIIRYQGVLAPALGDVQPSPFIRYAEVCLENRSDHEQIVHFLWQGSELWVPGATERGGALTQPLHIPPRFMGRWDIPVTGVREWPDEELSPSEFGYFRRRYLMTLWLQTDAGKMTRWRRPREVRVHR